jgi:uncharacterized protein (DUF2164 family)
MALTLTPEAQKQAVASMIRFGNEELEVDLSGVQAMLLLRFMLQEIGPTIYNRGVSDAQGFLHDRLGDLEATCYEPEFAYWPKESTVRRKR